MSKHYDAVVIGSGQGGTPLAMEFASRGYQTALVEREHLGGTCVNTGCTPTKTMVASARTAYVARRAADYGVQTGNITVNMEQVRDRKRSIVNDFRSGTQESLEGTENLDLIFGEATLAGEKTVTVQLHNGSEQTITAERIFIDTGTRPLVPPIPGLDSIPYLDNTSIMELAEVPEHLLVLGGGYVGLEFAQMFRRFGSQVTVIEMAEQLLAGEDADVSKAVYEILEEEGVDVRTDSKATAFEQREGGGIAATVETGGAENTITGSHLLVSVGRRPNTDALVPGNAGIETDERGFIITNDRQETNVAGIWGLGDVTGGPAFTHVSYDDFRIITTNVLDGGNASTESRIIPYVAYIDPQLGRVGYTENEARERFENVGVASLPMKHVARALETDETRGFMKAVVDTTSKRILGATVLGVEGGEVMSLMQTAIIGDIPYTVLRDGMYAHPTLAESMNTLFADIAS